MTKVAIIGGGPAGFAAARALAAEKRDWHITIYERQPIAGGVWNYTEDGPMYRDLETNVPKEFMAFKDYPLPDELPTYVTRQVIAAYFQQYGEEVARNDSISVEFNANVVKVSKESRNWTIELASGLVHEADFLLVASGHYEHPAYPNIPGLESFRSAHPDRVKHSKNYDEPSVYAGRSVLVIGNASSGIDLAIQLLSETDSVTLSRRTPSKADALFDGGNDIVLKPEAVLVNPERGEFEFADGSRGIYDNVLVATGYQWRYPFLAEHNAKQKRPFLIPPSYHRLQNLHHYIFHIDDPTLAFVMVNRMIVPIPWVESQAALIARVWSGRLELPSTQAMLATDAALVAEKGEGESYLTLVYPDDMKFMQIYDDLVSSLQEDSGFLAEVWSPERLQRRESAMPQKFADFKRKVAESRAKREARNLATRFRHQVEVPTEVQHGPPRNTRPQIISTSL